MKSPCCKHVNHYKFVLIQQSAVHPQPSAVYKIALDAACPIYFP